MSATSGVTTGTNQAILVNALFQPASLTVPAAGTYLATVSLNIVRTGAAVSEVSCRFGLGATLPLMYATVPRSNASNGVVLNFTAPVTSTLVGVNQVIRVACTNLRNAATYNWSALVVAAPLGSAAGTTYTG